MPVCFAAGVTCFCLGTQSPAKNTSGSKHTAPRTPATCGVGAIAVMSKPIANMAAMTRARDSTANVRFLVFA